MVLKTSGIVLILKESYLKHSVPSDIEVVFETYTENPKNLEVYPLDESVSKLKHLINQFGNLHSQILYCMTHFKTQIHRA